MGDRAHLSIGEVLSLLREEFADITISKIRFLESQGLVDPERTPSGYRKFYEDDVERLRWILRQQREHFLPLKVIKGRLSEADSDGELEALILRGQRGRGRAGARRRCQATLPAPPVLGPQFDRRRLGDHGRGRRGATGWPDANGARRCWSCGGRTRADHGAGAGRIPFESRGRPRSGRLVPARIRDHPTQRRSAGCERRHQGRPAPSCLDPDHPAAPDPGERRRRNRDGPRRAPAAKGPAP